MNKWLLGLPGDAEGERILEGWRWLTYQQHQLQPILFWMGETADLASLEPLLEAVLPFPPVDDSFRRWQLEVISWPG